MSSSHAIVKQINWLFLVPQILLLILFNYIYYLIGISDFFIFGVITYLIISYTTIAIIPRHHRTGIFFVKKGLYDKALEEFRLSYEFFNRHKWVDKYRCFFLFSSSCSSYSEMAMLNMAFCYGQLGEGLKSKELYQKVINQFPGSKMAESALKMYDAAKNI